MNWVGLAGAGAVVAFWLWPVSRSMRKGRAYRATFRMPSALLNLANTEIVKGLTRLLPPDGALSRDRDKLSITFTALRDEELTDIQTPFGPLVLVRLEELG